MTGRMRAGCLVLGLWMAMWVAPALGDAEARASAPLFVGGLLLASPILLVWWLAERAKQRREAVAARELELALAAPRVIVLHAFVVELPTEEAERLASEMDCGPALAHRAASALAAALPRVLRMTHRARSHVFDDDWREVIAREREARASAGRGYRDSETPELGPTRQVVWHLVAGYPDDPGPAPVLGSPGLVAWLDAIVPVVPARTQASEVRVRGVPALTEGPD